MQYTTKAAVEAYLGVTLPGETTSLDPQIDAMTEYIDKQCRRRVAYEYSETRRYKADVAGTVATDECASLEGLRLDGELITGFEEEPYNQNKTWRINDERIKRGSFIDITGIFAAHMDLPSDIAYACTVLVAGIVNTANAKGDIKSETIGSYSVTYESLNQKQDFARAAEIIAAHRKSW